MAKACLLYQMQENSPTPLGAKLFIDFEFISQPVKWQQHIIK
jgi:hypothetical protein